MDTMLRRIQIYVYGNNTDFNNGLKIEIQKIVMSIKKFILGVQKGKENYK